ncbi:hypothetical protein GBF38_017395, partial [Nibea albiflora]
SFTYTGDPDYGLSLLNVNGLAENSTQNTYWELLVKKPDNSIIRPDVGVHMTNHTDIRVLESELRKRHQQIEGFVLVVKAYLTFTVLNFHRSACFTSFTHVSGGLGFRGHLPMAGNDAHRLFTFTCPPGGPSMRKERPLLRPGDRSHHQGCIEPISCRHPSRQHHPIQRSAADTDQMFRFTAPRRTEPTPRLSLPGLKWCDAAAGGSRLVRVHNLRWLSPTASPFCRRMHPSILTLRLQLPPHLALKSPQRRPQRAMVRPLVALLQ